MARFLCMSMSPPPFVITQPDNFAVSSVEADDKGSPSLKAVMQFAEYFNVSLDYLVYGKENQNQNIVEISNPEDDALLESFHRLSPELRLKANYKTLQPIVRQKHTWEG